MRAEGVSFRHAVELLRADLPSYRYDDGGRLTAVRDALGRTSRYSYDFAGRLIGVRSPDLGGTHTEQHVIEHPVAVGEELASTFTPALLDGIEQGLADYNQDGYVSGTELGLYLQSEVPKHARQTPQFGKIGDYDLSRGDFIFLAQGSIEQDLPGPANGNLGVPLGATQVVPFAPAGSATQAHLPQRTLVFPELYWAGVLFTDALDTDALIEPLRRRLTVRQA